MIGTRIRYYRKRAGLTLEQLADGICSVSYLSKFEHGEGASDEIIQLLCNRLNISFEDVDNKEELNHINRLLDEWYEAIKNRNTDLIKDKENEVSPLMKNVEDPMLLIKFDLIKLRRVLMELKLSEAENIINNIEKFRDIFSKELLYYYYHFKGVYYYLTDQPAETIDFFTKAEILFHELKLNQTEKAELFYQISLAAALYSSINKCLQYAQNALDLFEEDYNLKRISDCQTLIGICHRRLKNYEVSINHYEQALKFASLYNDKERLAIIYHNLGYTQACLNNSSQAIKHFIKSYSYKDYCDAPKTCSTMYLLAEEYFKEDNINKSKKFLQEGLTLARDSNIEDSILKLEVLELRINKSANLLDYLKKDAIPYFKKNGKWDHVTEYAEELANIYFNKAQYKQASIYYRLANDARKKIN